MLTVDDKQAILAKLHSLTNIDSTTGCWLYNGGKAKGYGKLKVNRKSYPVHRLSAYIHLGLPLEDWDAQANHKVFCRNRHCWNPEHIYVGTQVDNMQDRNTGICPRGHKIDGFRLRLDTGRMRRHCKICADQKRKELRKRRVSI